MILHQEYIIWLMKTIISDLLDIINQNIEFIESEYPEIRDFLYQVNIFLKDNPTDSEILDWMLSNQDTIQNINKCVESLKKAIKK